MTVARCTPAQHPFKPQMLEALNLRQKQRPRWPFRRRAGDSEIPKHDSARVGACLGYDSDACMLLRASAGSRGFQLRLDRIPSRSYSAPQGMGAIIVWRGSGKNKGHLLATSSSLPGQQHSPLPKC